MKMFSEAESCTVTEFFGLPGAGKTWLAEKLSQEKGIPVISLSGRVEKYWRVVRFALERPAAFFFFLRKARKESRGNRALRSHKIRYIFFNAVAREHKASCARGPVLLDEGFAQFLLSLFEHEASREEVVECLRYFFPQHCIMIVEAPENIRTERFHSRGRMPRAFLDEAYRKQWMPILERNYVLIKSLLIQRFKTSVIDNV